MAKALLGHAGTTDPRVVAQLMAENRRLRQRVLDLESLTLRLQAENDQLAAAYDEVLHRSLDQSLAQSSRDASMQPA